MYVPPAFAHDDPDGVAAFLAAHPLALVSINGPEGPVAAHVPLVAVRDEAGAVVELVGHVARANPFWQAADGAWALAVFRGADAYVSPSAYPSKAVHHKVVPTWNYEAAELRGRLTIEAQPARLDRYIDLPTGMMEASRARPWATTDAPGAYIEAMKRGIVGLSVAVTAIQAKRKLSQNKDAADFHGVLSDLSTREEPGARAIATAMAELTR